MIFKKNLIIIYALCGVTSSLIIASEYETPQDSTTARQLLREKRATRKNDEVAAYDIVPISQIKPQRTSSLSSSSRPQDDDYDTVVPVISRCNKPKNPIYSAASTSNNSSLSLSPIVPDTSPLLAINARLHEIFSRYPTIYERLSPQANSFEIARELDTIGSDKKAAPLILDANFTTQDRQEICRLLKDHFKNQRVKYIICDNFYQKVLFMRFITEYLQPALKNELITLQLDEIKLINQFISTMNKKLTQLSFINDLYNVIQDEKNKELIKNILKKYRENAETFFTSKVINLSSDPENNPYTYNGNTAAIFAMFDIPLISTAASKGKKPSLTHD